MLEIKNLHAAIDGNEILKGINLTINKGEIHAIMGPNGSGKSTLAKVLAGHPQYEVTAGEIIYEGRNLLELAPDERARPRRGAAAQGAWAGRTGASPDRREPLGRGPRTLVPSQGRGRTP